MVSGLTYTGKTLFIIFIGLVKLLLNPIKSHEKTRGCVSFIVFPVNINNVKANVLIF